MIVAARGRSLVAVSTAPVLAYVLAWAFDQGVGALRAHRYGVPFSGLTPLLHPVLGVHLSLAATLAAAALAVLVAARLAHPPRSAVVLAAIVALLPSFGTVRDALRWSRAPRTRPFTMVPARRLVQPTPTAVEIDGRFFELDRAHAVEIADAWMLTRDGELVVQIGAARGAEVARLSWESVQATGENNGRGFVAIVVAGRPIAAATFSFVATAGRFAWRADGLAAALAP